MIVGSRLQDRAEVALGPGAPDVWADDRSGVFPDEDEGKSGSDAAPGFEEFGLRFHLPSDLIRDFFSIDDFISNAISVKIDPALGI